MSVQASVVLATARTLLNDDAASLWTDAALMPKLQQAHNELQVKLRRAACPVMKNTYTETIAATNTVFATPPTDLISPIKLWEKASADPVTNYALMTEVDILPNLAQASTMIYWAWIQEAVIFLGSSASRMILMQYWRSLTLPTVNTSSIGFLNGELYLAPRLAAIAAGSIGDDKIMGTMTTLAEQSINEVILSNRGRVPASFGMAVRQ
jgi:hypothetical protein